MTSRRRPRTPALGKCTETLPDECDEASPRLFPRSDALASKQLLCRLKAAALAYIRGDGDSYIERCGEAANGGGEEARLSEFWTEAMHGLWPHHLDELYEYVAKQLVACGGREQLDAIVCDMESSLAAMH